MSPRQTQNASKHQRHHSRKPFRICNLHLQPAAIEDQNQKSAPGTASVTFGNLHMSPRQTQNPCGNRKFKPLSRPLSQPFVGSAPKSNCPRNLQSPDGIRQASLLAAFVASRNYPAMRLASFTTFWLLLPFLSFSLSAASFTDEPVVVLDNGTPAVRALSQELSARKVHHEVMGAAAALAVKQNSRAVWVAASVAECRAADASAIIAHLRSGGGFLVLGQMPFQKILYKLGERWLPESAYLEALIAPTPILKFSATPLSEFVRSTSTPEIDSTLKVAQSSIPTANGTEQRSVAHVVIPKLAGWTTYRLPLPHPKPADAVTAFWARGTDETRQLALEWDETDGSRWIAKVNLASEWRYFVLKPADFPFFYGSPTKTRGGRGDRLHMENATSFSVGLAFTHTALGPGPHEFWLGDVCLAEPKPGQLDSVAGIPPVDGLVPASMAYPVHPARLQVTESFRHCLTGKLKLPPSAWSPYLAANGLRF